MRKAALAPLLLLALLPSASHASQEPRAVLVLLEPISVAEALRTPELTSIASGIGLLPIPDEGERELTARVPPEVEVIRGAASELAAIVPEGALVVAAAAEATGDMRSRRDLVAPVVVALPARTPGPLRGLTSDSTRRAGVVTPADVVATLRAHLGLPIDEGSPIRIEGDVPIRLHERYLAVRGMGVPMQLGVLGAVLLGLASAAVFVWRRGTSEAVARWLGISVLAAAALPALLLPVSVLARLGWPTVVGTLAALTALVVAAAWWVGRRAGPTVALGVVGATALTVLLLDAVRGWDAMAVPILGGGALDGARFFGLGNVYAAVLLGGAVVTAAHLGTAGGTALLAGAALFAGLPWLGADFGGAVMLFAAAGLWAVLRGRRELGWMEIAIVAGVVAAGTAVVVVAHAAFAGQGHVGQAVSSGAGGALEIFWRRLRINVETTSAVPVAWLLVLALPAAAWLAWRRWGPLRADPEWRDAVMVLAIATLVGVLANDTGVGIAGVGLVFTAAALLLPALEGRWTSR